MNYFLNYSQHFPPPDFVTYTGPEIFEFLVGLIADVKDRVNIDMLVNLKWFEGVDWEDNRVGLGNKV